MVELIEEGHGQEDVSCEHGSRWKWFGEDRRTRHVNRWVQVVFAPNCDCGEPPRPHKQEAES